MDAAAQHDELEAMAAIFDSSVFVAGDGQGSWMYLIRELWCFVLDFHFFVFFQQSAGTGQYDEVF